MKVLFKYGIKTYTGTLDEMTYGSYRDGSLCIGRKYVIPAETAQNASVAEISKNLATVYASCSAGYKADLKTYARKHEALVPAGKLAPNAYAIFVRMMYLFSELDSGHVDLASVSYADLQTIGADIASVADAVGSGYLPKVAGADALTAEM